MQDGSDDCLEEQQVVEAVCVGLDSCCVRSSRFSQVNNREAECLSSKETDGLALKPARKHMRV